MHRKKHWNFQHIVHVAGVYPDLTCRHFFRFFPALCQSIVTRLGPQDLMRMIYGHTTWSAAFPPAAWLSRRGPAFHREWPPRSGRVWQPWFPLGIPCALLPAQPKRKRSRSILLKCMHIVHTVRVTSEHVGLQREALHMNYE
jgi:hypothetical protein